MGSLANPFSLKYSGVGIGFSMESHSYLSKCILVAVFFFSFSFSFVTIFFPLLLVSRMDLHLISQKPGAIKVAQVGMTRKSQACSRKGEGGLRQMLLFWSFWFQPVTGFKLTGARGSFSFLCSQFDHPATRP